jgi:hypothetical protein
MYQIKHVLFLYLVCYTINITKQSLTTQQQQAKILLSHTGQLQQAQARLQAETSTFLLQFSFSTLAEIVQI